MIAVDPATRKVALNVPMPESVEFCGKSPVAAQGAVWISDCTTVLSRIDARTGQVTVVEANAEVGPPLDVNGDVWVPIGNLLVHLSPQLVADRAVKPDVKGLGVFGGVAFAGSVWVNIGDGVVARFPSPATW